MMNMTSCNILIVDDQEDWRDVLCELLQEEGHRVMAISNATSASSILENQDFDVVLLDVRLIDDKKYNLQGIGLLREIKRKSPTTGVIVITAYPNTEQRDLAVRVFGADAYLAKAPMDHDFKSFSIEELFDAINRIVGRKGT